MSFLGYVSREAFESSCVHTWNLAQEENTRESWLLASNFLQGCAHYANLCEDLECYTDFGFLSYLAYYRHLLIRGDSGISSSDAAKSAGGTSTPEPIRKRTGASSSECAFFAPGENSMGLCGAEASSEVEGRALG